MSATINRVLNPLPSKSHPVASSEFLSSLNQIWASEAFRGNKRGILGLAISGGVDSMALAALCSQAQTHLLKLSCRPELFHNDRKTFASLLECKFQAFIVDHRVRTGSTTEAHAVRKVLETWGIQSKVLNIEWPNHEKPSDLPNFESLARKYRYQVLGKACRDSGIASLLLAHHQDDQAETIMMRLCNGHGRSGLSGMKDDSEIPECYGMYGVHKSSGIVEYTANSSQLKVFGTTHATNHSFQDANRGTETDSKFLARLANETGGIRVYRPLLDVGKDRLIATSQSLGMEWFEDHTNKDPTLTTRNAIRHIYKNHQMPATLSKLTLLNLARRCRAKTDELRLIAQYCLINCYIRRFETRSGILSVRFENLDVSFAQLTQGYVDIILDLKFPSLDTIAQLTQGDKMEIAANMLQSAIMRVTPEEYVPISSLRIAIKRVFPELLPNQESLPSSTFTIAGVQFQPVTKKKFGTEEPVTSTSTDENSKCEWLLSRQSYNNSLPQPLTVVPPSKDPLLKDFWSEWSLYDGRYWIRVQNIGTPSIVIRPFQKQDLQPFRNSLSAADSKQLTMLLKDLAPGNVRWSLPSIVLREGNMESVLALPSLGIGNSRVNGLVRWEIRYKKV